MSACVCGGTEGDLPKAIQFQYGDAGGHHNGPGLRGGKLDMGLGRAWGQDRDPEPPWTRRGDSRQDAQAETQRGSWWPSAYVGALQVLRRSHPLRAERMRVSRRRDYRARKVWGPSTRAMKKHVQFSVPGNVTHDVVFQRSGKYTVRGEDLRCHLCKSTPPPPTMKTDDHLCTGAGWARTGAQWLCRRDRNMVARALSTENTGRSVDECQFFVGHKYMLNYPLYCPYF